MWFGSADPRPHYQAAEADYSHVLRLRPNAIETLHARGRLWTMRAFHKVNIGVDPLAALHPFRAVR